MKDPQSRATELVAPWRRASACMSNNCVEVAVHDDGSIAVRDSKNPSQVPLVFTRDEMRAWVEGVKAGEFDDLW